MAGTVYYKMDDGTKIPLNPIPQASSVVTSTTNFGGILSGTDATVQAALDTIDDHNHDSIYLNVANTTVYTPTANYHPATKKYVDDEISGIDLTAYLRKDGTVSLTADWDAGSWQIRAETFQSDVATGTAPLVIASTTLVSNLNADLLDGKHETSFFLADGTRYLPNNTYILARNAADTANINMFKVNASDVLEMGVNMNIGTYSLGDGTGTLVFSGAGDLALNGGSFDIDASEYYQIGGLNIFTADADTVLMGVDAGDSIGMGASGTVSYNLCVGDDGGYWLGKSAAGNVQHNCAIGSEAGKYAGLSSGGIFQNMFIGHTAGFYMGGLATGQACQYNVAIGSASGHSFGKSATGGAHSGNLLFGRQSGYYCGQNTTTGGVSNNIILGYWAGYYLSKDNTYGPYSNVIIGSYAFRNAGQSGSSYVRQNVVIGEYAGAYWSQSTSGGSRNILIGAYAGYGGSENDKLIISSVNETTYADNLAKAIITGTMSDTTADQTLFLHATTQIGVGGSNYVQVDAGGAMTFAGAAKITAPGYHLSELSADPSDPAEGYSVLWQSDGTGSGDDGDILIKITAGGSTKTVTLVDFSAA